MRQSSWISAMFMAVDLPPAKNQARIATQKISRIPKQTIIGDDRKQRSASLYLFYFHTSNNSRVQSQTCGRFLCNIWQNQLSSISDMVFQLIRLPRVGVTILLPFAQTKFVQVLNETPLAFHILCDYAARYHVSVSTIVVFYDRLA